VTALADSGRREKYDALGRTISRIKTADNTLRRPNGIEKPPYVVVSRHTASGMPSSSALPDDEIAA
jgi:hypothetical protein